MSAGAVKAADSPHEVLTSELVEEVFGLRSIVVPDPVTGTPMIVPRDPRGPVVDLDNAAAASAR